MPDRRIHLPRALRITGAASLLALLPALAATAADPATARAQHLDVRPFVAAVDFNHDGCMDQHEWQTAGAPTMAYGEMKDAKGCVTEAIMAAKPVPPGLDADGDGVLTLQELKDYGSKMPPPATK